MKSSGKGQLWSWILALPLAAFLLYWSLRGVDWHSVWTTITGARWIFLAGAGLFTCLSFFLRSLRWRILLNAEADLPVGAIFCATMAGYLGNAFLPARAGELIRTLVVSGRSTLSKTYVLTTALSERLMDVIALVLWASLILLGVHPKPDWMGGVARTMAFIAGLGAVAIAVIPHTGGLCQNVLRRLPLPHALRDRLIGLTDQVLLGMRAFHNTGRFVGFAALTIVIWVSDALGTMTAARALHLPISFPMAMLLLTGLGLGSALPSTPGYVGIYQFVAVTVLVPLGIAKSSALAFILLTQAYGYAVTLLLGLPCLWILRSKAPLQMAEAERVSLNGILPFPPK
jgi:glycosyltransferase 2 family protein